MEKSNRRKFLKRSGAILAGSFVAGSFIAPEVSKLIKHTGKKLQVWSCGGLAEAFIPANEYFEKETESIINYSGAFAAALGKSLLGNAQTEIFAPRVLELAKKLKEQGKMEMFKPLCFTKYVLITPKGNPAGIKSIEDLTKQGIKIILSPEASPPGGKATIGIMKKAGVIEKAMPNVIHKGDCVQLDVNNIVNGTGDVAIVEKRITKLPGVIGNVEIINIPEEHFPPKPIPFVIGIMKFAKDRELAESYVDYIISEKGQSFFENAGFIPAYSDEGERLINKLNIKDV